MASMDGELWRHNLVKVVVLDVSDDYVLMQDSLPVDCYPVVMETYLHRPQLSDSLVSQLNVSGFLYDWHESAGPEEDAWYVGVVNEQLAKTA